MEIRTYSQMISLPTFEDRFRYLQLSGQVGHETFGFDRYLNQALYSSKQWLYVRDQIIVRDSGLDLAHEDHPIYGKIIIHHMNPVTEMDIRDRADILFDPEFLVCVSHMTHNAIHYGDESFLPEKPIERRANDQCPWRQQ